MSYFVQNTAMSSWRDHTCPDCGAHLVADLFCPRAQCGWTSPQAVAVDEAGEELQGSPPWLLEEINGLDADGVPRQVNEEWLFPKRHYKPVTMHGRIVHSRTPWRGSERQPIGWGFDHKSPLPDWPDDELMALCSIELDISVLPTAEGVTS